MPHSPEPPATGIVTVLATGNPNEIIVAKLLLEAEQVPFIVVGEAVQDLFGFGRTFGPYNPITGPVQIRVAAENAELALEILAEMRATNAAKDATTDDH